MWEVPWALPDNLDPEEPAALLACALLAWRPRDRLGAGGAMMGYETDLKLHPYFAGTDWAPLEAVATPDPLPPCPGPTPEEARVAAAVKILAEPELPVDLGDPELVAGLGEPLGRFSCEVPPPTWSPGHPALSPRDC